MQYKALKSLREKCLARHPYLKALSSFDPLVMEGRAIQFNRQTPLHPDHQDPRKSWATMITIGKFTTGGELRIPRLNLEMRYLPRDVVFTSWSPSSSRGKGMGAWPAHFYCPFHARISLEELQNGLPLDFFFMYSYEYAASSPNHQHQGYIGHLS